MEKINGNIYETSDGKVVRFFITGVNMDAVDYFLQRVEAVDTISPDCSGDGVRDLNPDFH